MKHKGRTIGIIILCAVVVLLAINWQVQPLHKLRQQDAVPTYAHIIRSGVDGRTVVEVTDPQALQALQDSARQAVPLWVGPSPRSYMLEEGDIYHVYRHGGPGFYDGGQQGLLERRSRPLPRLRRFLAGRRGKGVPAGDYH